MTPPVPFKAQSLEQLRRRYASAIVTTRSVRRIQAGGKRPGQSPINVFDFEDGVRLIVNDELNDTQPKSSRYLHVTASLLIDDIDRPARPTDLQSRLFKAIDDIATNRIVGVAARDVLEAVLLEHFRELSGDDRRVELRRFTGAVFHWTFVPAKAGERH